jgi:hypothetical protein
MAAGNTPEAWQTWLPRIYKTYAWAVGVCVVGAFSESFANLITYFRHAGLILGLAIIAPSMIDIFTVGGETLVLIATVKHWPLRYKIGGWVATFAGLSMSVAGNVGKDGWRHLNPNRAVAYAIAPLALAGLLALGLAIVKRVLADEEEDAKDAERKAAAARAATPAAPVRQASPVVPADITVTDTPDRRPAPARRPRPQRPLRPATRAYTRFRRPAAAPAIRPSVIVMPWPVAAKPAPSRPRPPAPAKTPPTAPAPRTVKADPAMVRRLRDQGIAPADVAAQLGISARQERRLANPRQRGLLASANGSTASPNGSGSC